MPTLPAARPHRASEPPIGPVLQAALADGRAVVRLPPSADLTAVAAVVASRGNALVVCPTTAMADRIAASLRRTGSTVAQHPAGWAVGAAGATVVGARAAAWAPVGDLAAVLVLDEHDEVHQQEQTPTWHARDVAIERAARAGVPCVLTSPCPSLEALAWGNLHRPERARERAGWPVVQVIDRRDDDPREGLLPPALTAVLRSDQRVLCVLNRLGRSKLLVCVACGEVARCERCEAAVEQPKLELRCRRCEAERPVVCLHCGAARFKNARAGVSRVREELEALVGEPVSELTAASGSDHPSERVVVGTEAVLQRIDRADVVVFLDLDQELLAPRYRAAEQALALLARAARVVTSATPRVGGRAGGRLVLQTRAPHHEVVQAAVHADPSLVADAEAVRRSLLQLPPTTAMAEVSGPAAPAYLEALGRPAGVQVAEVAEGRWLLRAADHEVLCGVLAAVRRPPGRVRVAVDPLRV